MKKEWHEGRNPKPAPCGVYDVSNLLDLDSQGTPIMVGVGNDDNNYIENTCAFLGVQEADDRHLSARQLRNLIETNSDQGRTPLGSMVIIGHAAAGLQETGDREANPNFTFDLNTLSANNQLAAQARRWQDAVDGYMPVIGWFRTDASVIFIGCQSGVKSTGGRGSSMASGFAERYLQGIATAWGTSVFVWCNGSVLRWANEDAKHRPKNNFRISF